jgi:hypothetical protein
MSPATMCLASRRPHSVGWGNRPVNAAFLCLLEIPEPALRIRPEIANLWYATGVLRTKVD